MYLAGQPFYLPFPFCVVSLRVEKSLPSARHEPEIGSGRGVGAGEVN